MNAFNTGILAAMDQKAQAAQLQAQQMNAQDWYMQTLNNGVVYGAKNDVYVSKEIPKKEISMLKEVRQDATNFVREHKSVIYWVAVLLIVDHFVFQGTFKEKLKNIMNNLVTKVETKLTQQA